MTRGGDEDIETRSLNLAAVLASGSIFEEPPPPPFGF